MNAGVAVTAVNGQAISNNNIINQSREDVTIFSFFMPENRQKGKVMKDKFESLGKRIVALLLSVLTVTMMFPLSAFAATENLGAVSGMKKLDVSVSKHYGHEVHTTKKGGTTYPLFCIEYGTTSPSSSYLKGKKAMASDTAIKAAKWIFAGYYLEHGNSIDWQDMAYCQKKVWSIFGSDTSWDFSDGGYKAWCDKAQDRMDNLNKKPSFNNTNVGTVVAGSSLTVTDTNKVLSDYPAFTKNGSGWSITHSKNSNSLTIKVDKSCTASSFKLANGEYYKDGTGDDDELLLYYPYGSEAYQKLIYSAYYDPVSMAFSGSITPLGDMKLVKTSEDGIVAGINFTVTGANGFLKTVTTNANGEIDISNLASGTYTITEENIDRYVPNQSQTITVSSNKTSSVSFYNILKKFRVTVTKQDYEKGHAQGDAKLGGAVYGLYKGNELIAQYTTDSNGSFTTDYFVCGTDWTVREISPSEGYLLNDTVYRVGADPRDYNIEYNTAPDMTVMEQVIKGKISIIKHTDDGETQIETPEKGAEFQVYLKSAGSFVNADKDERDTIVCDEDGFASTKLLPYGVYTVHQTKGWDGREKITDFDVFINTDGKTYKFLINNKNFESYLKVVKLDKETGKQIAYEGAAFEIYDSDNHRISMQFTYPQVTTIHTFYTNSEGYLITPEKLPYGDYTLIEVQAPYGYVLDSTPIPFTITQENSSTDTGVTVVKVKARDMAQKGVIEITKTGEVFATVNENEGIYTPVYETQNLANAVFQIYAAEDITTLDGTVRVQQGELVDEIVTGANGIAKSKQLYLGKYTVIEKTAPNGYVNANEQYNVELTYAGQNVSVTSTALTVNNDRQKVTVSLEKALEKDKLFNIGDNDEILSVQFGVFANEDITAADGSIIPKDALITFANCDIDGKITFDCDLPIGYEFYAKEIATDEQYILSDTKYEFETAYAGQETEVITININDGKPIDNTITRGKVSGVKKDENGNALGGALIGLFKVDTTEYTKENALMTATSADDGSFYFDNVPYGNWCVREIAPPTAFVLNEQIFDVNIAENEQVVEIEIVNEFIRGIIALTKVDKDYPDNKLTGAEFEVFEDTNGNGEYDNEDKSIGKLTEIETGIYAMNDLVYGQYFVREIKAPENFLLDENVYSVFIDTDGKTYIVENEAGVGFINAAITGSLKIVKTSSDGKVEGFSFRVTGVNGYDKTFKTDKNGEILIENLRIGEYHIAEVSDKVSAGYILADDKDATVKADATTIVKMHNEKKKTPKTSDNINKRALATAISVSALGAVSLAYYLLKKKKNNKEEK